LLTLVEGVPPDSTDRDASPPSGVELPRTVPARLHCRGEGGYSLTVDDFAAFDTPEDLEQDIVVTAYDLQDAVKACLRELKSSATKQLDFNSESSLFSVDSASLPALVEVTEIVFQLATDATLRDRYLRKDNRQRTRGKDKRGPKGKGKASKSRV
jgi:hypothetical protein